MNKDTSVEDLLKPRYRVMADYPHMAQDEIGVGDIISPYGMGFLYPEEVKKKYDSFPHLFKRLEWWEDRKPEEMPEYVKEEGDKIFLSKWRMREWDCMKMVLYEAAEELQIAEYYVVKNVMCFFEPATLEEFNQYNSTLKQKK